MARRRNGNGDGDDEFGRLPTFKRVPRALRGRTAAKVEAAHVARVLPVVLRTPIVLKATVRPQIDVAATNRRIEVLRRAAPPPPPRRMPRPPPPAKEPAIRLTPTRREVAQHIPAPEGSTIVSTIPPNEQRDFVHKRILGAATGFVTGGLGGAAAGFLTGGSGSARFTGSDPGAGLGITSCPPGTVRGRDGVCERTGFRAQVQQALPGGRTGTQADIFGDAVVGFMGVPALVPAQVPSFRQQCPPGMVLGRDNLCYNKGTKGVAAFRKWPPGTKPFLTGGEVKCIRRANTLMKSKTKKAFLKGLGMG